MLDAVKRAQQAFQWMGRFGLCIALVACGGGGGGGLPFFPSPPPATEDGEVSAVVEPTLIGATLVHGQPDVRGVSFSVTLKYTGNRKIYLGTRDETGVLEDYGIVINGLQLAGHARPSNALAPGVYRGSLFLLACFDEACTQPVSGSPMKLPQQWTVLPNLQVPASLLLARQGQEPAPVQEFPIEVPAEAGELVISSQGSRDQVSLTWTGSALRVVTTQARAGTYTLEGYLSSRSDPRYGSPVRVIYQVLAPPGGEKEYALLPAPNQQTLAQGSAWRQTVQLQRPTWISTSAQPVLLQAGSAAQLRSLGNDLYELSYDTAGLPVGHVEELVLTVSPEEGGGGIHYRWPVAVSEVVSVAGWSIGLDDSSTAEALRLSAAVALNEGPPQRWTARSPSPWLSLVRSAGTTGVDPLEVQLDAATLTATNGDYRGQVELSVDRPGTTSITVPVDVRVRMQYVNEALAASLLPGRDTLYVDVGWMDLHSVAHVQVTGARVISQQVPGSFVDGAVLKLELEDLQPGRDVVVRSALPLRTSEVRVPVRARLPAQAAGYQALPYARWRSAQYSERQQALYFAAPGVVARWGAAGPGWSLLTVPVAGLLDATPAGDDRNVYGVGGAKYFRFDAASLALTGEEAFAGFFDRAVEDDLLPLGQRRLAMGIDGRAFAVSGFPGTWSFVSVYSDIIRLTGWNGQTREAGSLSYRTLPPGVTARAGIVRSSNGRTVLGQYASGDVVRYDTTVRTPLFATINLPGLNLRAVSDDGSRWLLADGRLVNDGLVLPGSLNALPPKGLVLPGNLNALLPQGWTVGGHALTGSGRHALLYAYRQVQENGVARARDAGVWVVALPAAMAAAPAEPSAVVAQLPLPDALGCTAPLEPDETCEHEVSIHVPPGELNAYLLGPRAVASLPLPEAARTLAARKPQRQRLQLYDPGAPNSRPR